MRILALGTFVNNLFISKIQPLSEFPSELELHWLVDHPKCKGRQEKFTYPEQPGLHYEVVPAWMQKCLGRNLGKLVWGVIRSLTPGYDIYFSYYIWPHGLMLFLLNVLHFGRLRCVHFLISGDDELKAAFHSASGIKYLRWCARPVERCLLLVLRSFSFIAVKGSVSREYLKQNGINRAIVFPGSIDIQRFSPNNAEEKTIDLITVARIDVRKNQETLIKTVPTLLKEFPSLQVMLVGRDGPGSRSKDFSPNHGGMHQLVRDLHVESHVRFLEFTTQVEELYRKSKIYVQNSLSEGLSTSLREAQACGLPAIATDVGDTRDVVGDDKGGILISDPASQEELACAITRLLRNEDLCNSMGNRARRLVEAKHSIAYERELYKELLGGLLGKEVLSTKSCRHDQAFFSASKLKKVRSGQRVKILFLIHRFIQGGAEQQLYELVKSIDKQKFDVTVGCLVSGGEKWKEFHQLAGVRVECFDRRNRFDLSVLWRIMSFLRANPVDILHTYLAPATFFGFVAGILARTPVLIMGERGTKTAFATVGARVYFSLEKLVSRYADLIIANSNAGKEWKTELGVRPDRVVVVPNGVNAERLTVKVKRSRSEMGITGQSFIIGNVARLVPMKDHDTLLRAVELVKRECSDITCVVIGDGPLRGQLERTARQKKLERNVLFLGHQDHVADFIRLFDVAALSSQYREGCSNFILEAMYCGKPVVATDVGGAREVINDGVTGFVVSPQDPQALASALLRLLKSERLRQLMGHAAHERVEQEFMVEQMARRTEQLYEQLLFTKFSSRASTNLSDVHGAPDPEEALEQTRSGSSASM